MLVTLAYSTPIGPSVVTYSEYGCCAVIFEPVLMLCRPLCTLAFTHRPGNTAASILNNQRHDSVYVPICTLVRRGLSFSHEFHCR